MELNSIEFWDSMKDRYLENKDTRDNPYEYGIIAKHCIGSVLEFGSCFGMFSKYLSEAQKKFYIGCEISPRLVEKAREFNPNIPFTVGSILESGFKTGSFDTVVAFQLLEHFDTNDFIRAISEMKRIADKRIIFSVPNRNMIPDASHVQEFDYEKVFNIFKMYGSITFLPCYEHHIVGLQDNE